MYLWNKNILVTFGGGVTILCWKKQQKTTWVFEGSNLIKSVHSKVWQQRILHQTLPFFAQDGSHKE